MVFKYLKNLFINIFTSGKYFKEEKIRATDYFIRYVLMNFILFISFSAFVYYGTESLTDHVYWMFFIYLAMALIVIIVIIMARTNIAQIIPGIISFVFLGLFCGFMLWYGYTYGSIVLFLYPLLVIMAVGLNAGCLLASILFLVICFFGFIPQMSRIQYNFGDVIQILINYLVVLSIAVVIEKTRFSKDKIIEEQKRELQNFNENLQELVSIKTIKVVKLQSAILSTMADLVEYRDYVTGEHIERTKYGVNILLNEIKKQGLFANEVCNWDIPLLLQSAQLHDIGKIAISDQILKKPGALSKDEFDEMKNHTVFGSKIIERIEADSGENDLLNHAKIFALTHHEKWDGTGYPTGLQGDKIPLQGRIMAIVDVFDALVSERPYKKAFSHDEAVKMIIDGKGKQFDPVLTEVFAKISHEFEKTNHKMICRVS